MSVYKGSQLDKKINAYDDNKSTCGVRKMQKTRSEKRFNYTPKTSENGVLASYKAGAKFKRTVRVLDNLYYSDDGFALYRVEEKENVFIVKGVFPTSMHLGSYYEIEGKVSMQANEKQVEITAYRTVYPSDREGIVNVLKGLYGLDVKANELYDTCGPDVLEKIRTSPKEIAQEINSLGFPQSKVLQWQQQLQMPEREERAIQILLSYGLEPKRVKELLDECGVEITEQLKKNPYLLMDYVQKQSFQDCDRIALENGTQFDDFERLRNATLYGLKRITERGGHTYATEQDFFEAVKYHAGYPLNFRQAQAILKQARALNRKVLKYSIGDNKVAVDTEDLAQRIQDWKREAERRTFSYLLYHCRDDKIEQTINVLMTAGSVVCDHCNGTIRYRISKYAVYEKKIAEDIERILNGTRDAFNSRTVEKAIYEVLNERSRNMGKLLVLEEKQMVSLKLICGSSKGVFVLTGPAGSGKTFILSLVLEVLQRLYQMQNKDFYPRILAPTGKAAKVAESSTGMPASTIHRFVGYVTGTDRFIDGADMYVVDEMSMVDEELLSLMLRLVPSHAKLILVGDRNQLPSIGAGSCLRDIAESGCVPVVNLDVVKRQEKTSGILLNANKILAGKAIKTERINRNGDAGNAYVVIREDPIQAREQIIEVARRAGIRRFQEEKIQVICPRKSGETGTYIMNLLIQKAVNPYSPGAGLERNRYPASNELKYQDETGKVHCERLYFQTGDRVIHIKNDYKMEWYRKDPAEGLRLTGRQGIVNGETGVIERIYGVKEGTKTTMRIVVRYGNEYVIYEGSKIKEIMHAYAITIHRAQGSQWPIVLCPIMDNDYIMLSRQLLYTMYTRAQSTFFLVGSLRAIMGAIKNNIPIKRQTMLQEELIRQLRRGENAQV